MGISPYLDSAGLFSVNRIARVTSEWPYALHIVSSWWQKRVSVLIFFKASFVAMYPVF